MTFHCSSIHACVLMKVLLKNYIAQRKCPEALLPSSEPQHGALYKAGSAMACKYPLKEDVGVG